MNNKVDKKGYPITKKDKEWPPDEQAADFEEITYPIVRVLKIAIKKGDKVYKEGIRWTGFKQGEESRATVPSPSVMLHAKNLKYSKEDQGRDVYTEIISIAVQLGIEQGRRITLERAKDIFFLSNSNIKAIAEMVDKLKEKTNE